MGSSCRSLIMLALDLEIVCFGLRLLNFESDSDDQ